MVQGGVMGRLPHALPGGAGKKWRRADTNVIAVKFDQLTAPSNMHTGDPVICSGCQAMLSSAYSVALC